MFRVFVFLVLSLCVLLTGCGSGKPAPVLTEATVVEAGCGRCMFGRKEDKKCNLAIQVDGKSYFVDGFTMRQFGDPDLEGGMCKKVHQARVTGEVVNNRFAATAFELIPSATP